MTPFKLTTFINAISNFIACEATDEEIALLSSIFTQLGDTLVTISIQRNICKKSD